MKNHYLDLWKYNDWANRKVLEMLNANKIEVGKVISLMSHVLSAQFIWHLRITDKPTSVFPVWETYRLRELVTMNEDSTKNWFEVIEKWNDYETMIPYQNSTGTIYSSSLVQIMTHLINHGTHHRAQIASLFKYDNIQPPVLDYIAYTRL